MLSCESCEISESTFFTEHLWATASEYIMIRSSEEAMNVGKYNFFQEIWAPPPPLPSYKLKVLLLYAWNLPVWLWFI